MHLLSQRIHKLIHSGVGEYQSIPGEKVHESLCSERYGKNDLNGPVLMKLVRVCFIFPWFLRVFASFFPGLVDQLSRLCG